LCYKILLKMKKISLLFAATGILFISSCGNTEESKTETPPVETVAPTVGPAQEAGAAIDAATDSAKNKVAATASEVKEGAGKVVEDAKQGVKDAATAVKAEANKAATKVDVAATKATEATKAGAAKVAGKVEDAAKSTKEALKK
jgi:hypothetical protein